MNIERKIININNNYVQVNALRFLRLREFSYIGRKTTLIFY